MENKNAKIKILKKGSLKYLDIQNVDLENYGASNIKELSLREASYINEKGAETNVEGKLNTDSSVRNYSLFNIKKSGIVNIFRKHMSKKEGFLSKYIWPGIFGLIFTLIRAFILFILGWNK
ncbi:MAG: hypothetical protein AABY32_05795 [Nanoarchaeota archaeon]